MMIEVEHYGNIYNTVLVTSGYYGNCSGYLNLKPEVDDFLSDLEEYRLDSTFIYFNNMEDALAFKLRWGHINK